MHNFGWVTLLCFPWELKYNYNRGRDNKTVEIRIELQDVEGARHITCEQLFEINLCK